MPQAEPPACAHDGIHRLEDAVGPDLARLLLFALAVTYREGPDGGFRTGSSP
jgi:hypothetical protein